MRSRDKPNSRNRLYRSLAVPGLIRPLFLADNLPLWPVSGSTSSTESLRRSRGPFSYVTSASV